MTKVYGDISFNYTLTLIYPVFKSIFSLYLQSSVIVTAKTADKSDISLVSECVKTSDTA